MKKKIAKEWSWCDNCLWCDHCDRIGFCEHFTLNRFEKADVVIQALKQLQELAPEYERAIDEMMEYIIERM